MVAAWLSPRDLYKLWDVKRVLLRLGPHDGPQQKQAMTLTVIRSLVPFVDATNFVHFQVLTMARVVDLQVKTLTNHLPSPPPGVMWSGLRALSSSPLGRPA